MPITVRLSQGNFPGGLAESDAMRVRKESLEMVGHRAGFQFL